jgi:hypothetical protein
MHFYFSISHPNMYQIFIFAGEKMVVVAQLVRAPDCGSGGRGFESHHPPKKKGAYSSFFILIVFANFFLIVLLEKTLGYNWLLDAFRLLLQYKGRHIGVYHLSLIHDTNRAENFYHV